MSLITYIALLSMMLASIPSTTPIPCPSSDWKEMDGQCYRLITSGNSWSECESLCNPGHIVCINSEQENNMLYSELLLQNIPTGFYIGLRDVNKESVWKWQQNCSSTFTNWACGEPNNHRGREDCNVVPGPADSLSGELDGKWNDVNCDRSYYCMCEYADTEVYSSWSTHKSASLSCYPLWWLYLIVIPVAVVSCVCGCIFALCYKFCGAAKRGHRNAHSTVVPTDANMVSNCEMEVPIIAEARLDSVDHVTGESNSEGQPKETVVAALPTAVMTSTGPNVYVTANAY